jgi:ATP-dependent protease ClpP protease subunit
MAEKMQENVERARLEKEELEDLGTVTLRQGAHTIHCLTVIGQIEGHSEAPQGQKTTKYEHVIPQLVAVQEDPRIEGLLVLLNTVGGDVEAGLALAELIASISKPSATLVLGGGHSIGIPLAVSAQHSFIVPTATMTVHPVRHSGIILGVPQTMHWFDQMQQRITGFVAAHSGMTEKRYTELMLHTGELVMDMGTVLDGRRAVKEKLIDDLGGLSEALDWLYGEIEGR